MPNPNYISGVEIHISQEPDGRFKGHAIDGEERITTVPNKSRTRAIRLILTEAEGILMTDNQAIKTIPELVCDLRKGTPEQIPKSG